MTLIDPSLWLEHLRRGHAGLAALLERGAVAFHPYVVGELACGHLHRRREILGFLAALPSAEVTDHDEALAFAGANRLAGRGLGWIDVHLLASARLSGTPLWTLDRRLDRAARGLALAAT